MPNSATAELYFIASMMILILVVCGVACYFFFKTFRREREAKELAALKRKIEKEKAEAAKVETANAGGTAQSE
jgi:uncharacterized protein YpmB